MYIYCTGIFEVNCFPGRKRRKMKKENGPQKPNKGQSTVCRVDYAFFFVTALSSRRAVTLRPENPTSETIIPKIQTFTAKNARDESHSPGMKDEIPWNSRRKAWWSQRAWGVWGFAC